MSREPKKWTEREIVDLLRVRYSGQDHEKKWIAAPQVRASTGVTHCRTIDFLAVHCWPSKFSIVGHEIKCARQDWLNELKSEKYEDFANNCHEFFFVGAADVIKETEVPEGFGLLRPQKGRVVQKIAARKKPKKDVQPPPLFWCALLRAVDEKARDFESRERDYAEFHGKSVSLQDLRDLNARIGGWELDRLRKQVERHHSDNREKQRADRKFTAEDWTRNGGKILAVALEAVGLDKWRYDHEEARKRFAAIQAPRRGAELATRLRELADQIETTVEP